MGKSPVARRIVAHASLGSFPAAPPTSRQTQRIGASELGPNEMGGALLAHGALPTGFGRAVLALWRASRKEAGIGDVRTSQSSDRLA